MKEKTRAKNLSVALISAQTDLTSLVTAYTTWRTANPNAVVPEGGIKVLCATPPFVTNSSRSFTYFSAATQVDLKAAYDTWKTTNPNYVVLFEGYSIDATAGSVTHNLVVSYITSGLSFTRPYVMAVVDYYLNDSPEQS